MRFQDLVSLSDPNMNVSCFVLFFTHAALWMQVHLKGFDGSGFEKSNASLIKLHKAISPHPQDPGTKLYSARELIAKRRLNGSMDPSLLFFCPLFDMQDVNAIATLIAMGLKSQNNNLMQNLLILATWITGGVLETLNVPLNVRTAAVFIPSEP